MVARAWLDAHEPHVTDRGGRGVRQSLDRLLGETRSTAGAWPAVSPKLRAAVLVKMMVDGGTWPWCLVEEGAMWRSQVGDDARRAALGPNGGAATDRAPATIRSRRRGTAFGDQLLHRQRGSWVHHYAGCTICEQCRSGWPQMCSRTAVRVIGGGHHGGHALFLRVPAATLVP